MSTTTTVSVRNQVSIPAEFARTLGIAPGSRLRWSAGHGPDTLVVTVLPAVRDEVRRLRGRGKGAATRQDGSAVADLGALREEGERPRQP
jgi:bifunctional DNA-binding transcriptional regulator/antitoxin component of YhaV-PrlF toxin-antitoxin module